MDTEPIFNRIGFGCMHIWVFVLLCAIEIINSYQIVIMSLLTPHLKKQWNLEESVEDIPLFLYSGIIFGSFVAGSLANYAGRKQSLIIGLLLESLSNSFLIFTMTFDLFLANLFVLGVGIGITLVTGSTLCTELFSEKYRGRALLLLNFISILGKFLAIGFMFIEMAEGWRNSQIYGFVIVTTITILTALKIPQSPRILLAKGNVAETIEVIDSFLRQQSKPCLTNQQKDTLNIFAKYSQQQLTSNVYSLIFKKQYLKVTLILSLNWFIINFLFYGQLFIMPFIFQKQTEGFTHFAEMICGQIPSILMTINMIERERLGRKYTLVIFFLAATLLNFTSIYYNSIMIIAVTRMSMKSIFQILYPLTAESYPTPLRSFGLAFCSGLGRIGSIIMPILIFPLYERQPYYVYLGFMGFSMLGLYSSLAAKETLHQNIDCGIMKQLPDESATLTTKQDNQHKKLFK